MHAYVFAIACALGAAASSDDIASPVAPPRSMTFVQAVEAGLAYNIDAAFAQREVDRAHGVAREAMAQALPTLVATGSYGHLDHARELAGKILTPDAQVNGNVTLALPLIAPRAWGNGAEARGAYQVSRAQLAQSRRDVAIRVAQAYLDVVAQAQAQSVIAQAVATNAAHVAYAKTRFEGGVGNRLDLLRAGQELATSEVQAQSSATAWLTAREVLGQLVGYAGPIDAVDDVALPQATTHPEALTRLSHRRADVRATLSRLLQAQRVRRNSWLDFMPTLMATGQIFGQAPNTPTAPHFGWQVQLVVSVPLYDGGARYGRMQQRHALESSADLALNDAARRAQSEVRIALGAAAQAEQALLAAERAASQGAQALSVATQAYQGGLRQNLEVIDAARQARDTATQAVLAHNTLRRAQVMLAAATGQFPD